MASDGEWVQTMPRHVAKPGQLCFGQRVPPNIATNSKCYFQYLETICGLLSLPSSLRTYLAAVIRLLQRQRRARRTDKSPLHQRGGSRC
jgi:hypothetical protein